MEFPKEYKTGMITFYLRVVYGYLMLAPSGQAVRNAVYKTLCRLVGLNSELNAARRLRNSDLTKKWKNWEISNFDYLMQLNTIGSARSLPSPSLIVF